MPNRFQFPMDEAYTAMVEKSLADGVRRARQQLSPSSNGRSAVIGRPNPVPLIDRIRPVKLSL
jgi:hypothetical protein